VTFPSQKNAAPPEVVHTARYTLVNLTTDDSLRFPLRQIVSHTLPATHRHSLTREEALRRWLRGTGYGLCLAVTPAMKLFYTSPLPDAQRRMGPVRTEQALQTIAGSAWEMTTDEVSRTVCWQPSPASPLLS
jgi:type IV pili sensor histidine kinase/response regulator